MRCATCLTTAPACSKVHVDVVESRADEDGWMTRRARVYQARVRARQARSGGPVVPDPVGGGPVGALPAGAGRVGGNPAGARLDAETGDAATASRDPLRDIPVGPFPLLPGPVQVVDGEPFTVRPVTGAAAAKAYTCPWCLQLIAPRVPHVVVWPVQPRLDGAEGLSVRRHWHRHCWSSHVRTAASGRAR